MIRLSLVYTDYDKQLHDYYFSLPVYVQGKIIEHLSEIHSEQDLYRFAEKLMKNDTLYS